MVHIYVLYTPHLFVSETMLFIVIQVYKLTELLCIIQYQAL